MSDSQPRPSHPPATDVPAAGTDPVADRRAKLARLRQEAGVDPYGRRVDGLITLAQARALHDPSKPAEDKAAHPLVAMAGRIVLHRDIGKLIFMTLRDASGDLQVGVSKKSVDEKSFALAKLVDLGDLVVARGRIGVTKTGEITLWSETTAEDAAKDAPAFEVACKSLSVPPEKWHGLQDAELRYRQRYVDMYANPPVMQTMQRRSAILRRIREFLHNPPPELGPGFVEVETPTMQSIAGGAAARPFITHHNALDIDLYLRIAPELYLKRLLVGGMPRVFEVARNFRNEGLSPRHNPEFTMVELYQAFGDYNSMMDLIERLMHTLATEVCGADAANPQLPFGEVTVNYALPFKRAKYHDLFAQVNGFASSDDAALRTLARDPRFEIGYTEAYRFKEREKGLAEAEKFREELIKQMDHDVLLGQLWEKTVEPALSPGEPTFIIDYPASLCPLTRRKASNPAIAERFELYIAGMEVANAYTELNDPDIQEANFSTQLEGQAADDSMAKMDDDFINSLRVGMPPAGGLGFGVDRLVMLLTNSQSIRDVILFPLMKPGTATHFEISPLHQIRWDDFSLESFVGQLNRLASRSRTNISHVRTALQDWLAHETKSQVGNVTSTHWTGTGTKESYAFKPLKDKNGSVVVIGEPQQIAQVRIPELLEHYGAERLLLITLRSTEKSIARWIVSPSKP